MQSLVETGLFCLAIVAPALIAVRFKRDADAVKKTGAPFSRKPAHRFFGKRKHEALI